MYEQDIELARLLLERLTHLDQSAESLNCELLQVRDQLQHIATVRDERAQYLDILSRAARLLDRADLEVDLPPTVDLESQQSDLIERIDEVNREAQVYRELINELSQRAPGLIAAAGGEAPAGYAEEEEEPVAVPATEPIIEDQLPVEQEGAAVDPFSVDATADPAVVLNRFNVNNLKTKETFTFGRGAAYLMDATSVLERVPYYDTHMRAVREHGVRDELIHDMDLLSHELSGTFYVVFNSWHQPAVAFGNTISVEYGTGEGEGTKAAGDRRLRELADEVGGVERSVCIVTGDSTLSEELRAPGRHIISLGDFFRT